MSRTTIQPFKLWMKRSVRHNAPQYILRTAKIVIVSRTNPPARTLKYAALALAASGVRSKNAPVNTGAAGGGDRLWIVASDVLDD